MVIKANQVWMGKDNIERHVYKASEVLVKYSLWSSEWEINSHTICSIPTDAFVNELKRTGSYLVTSEKITLEAI